MSLVIEGGTIITMEKEKIIDDGLILINDNRIDFVGTRQEKRSQQADKTIKANGKYVLPGFINMHCHLFQVFLRTLGADMNLLDWLKKVIWPNVKKLTYKHSYNAALLGIAENIRSGVTTIVDMNYGNPNSEAILEAFTETKIRGFLSRGYYEIESHPLLMEDMNRILKNLQQMMEKHPNVMPGPMHPYNVSNDLLLKTKELTDHFGRKFYTHLAESEEDIQLLVQREGKRDAELLYSLGILDSDFIGVHGCNLNKKEILDLGQTKSNTVHCATSNMFIADGVSPITELSGSGVNVCIGTDGAASTGRLDMFSEMKTAALLQKIYYKDPSRITAKEILEMATVNGAKAMSLDAGMLKNGYLADILILDMHKANTVFSSDPISAIIYSATTENVDTVIVDGEVLLSKSNFTDMDEESILYNGHRSASRLFTK